jgi:hypothetical protein
MAALPERQAAKADASEILTRASSLYRPDERSSHRARYQLNVRFNGHESGYQMVV